MSEIREIELLRERILSLENELEGYRLRLNNKGCANNDLISLDNSFSIDDIINKAEIPVSENENTPHPNEFLNPLMDCFCETHANFNLLLDQMEVGFALHKMVYDELGNPIDYSFIDANHSYEKLTGLKKDDIIGKTVLEVFPKTEKTWIESYGRVAKTTNQLTFDRYSEETENHFKVKAYSPKRDFFVTILHDITDLKNKERLLQEENTQFQSINEELNAKILKFKFAESWEKFKKIFDFSASCMLQLNTRLEIIDINYSGCRLLGYTKEELVGRSVLEITHPDDVDISVELSENIKKDVNEIIQVEKRYIHKDGRILFTLLQVATILENGITSFYITQVIDITERKQFEQKLMESEETLTAIFDNAPTLMMLLNRNSEITKMNKAGLSLVGCEMSSILGCRTGDAFNCFEALNNPCGCGFGEFCKKCKIRNTILETLTTKNTHFKVEAELNTFINGIASIKTLLVSATLINGQNDYNVLVTLDDITERKGLENSIVERENRYKLIVESTKAIAWYLDLKKLSFTYVSPRIFELTGYDQNNWQHYEFWVKLIHPDDRAFVVRNCLVETQKVYDQEIEYRILAKDGTLKWIKDIVTVIKENGKPVALSGYFIDITDSKEIELALKESEESLNKAQQLGHLGSWELDIASGTEKWSAETYRICGYTPGSIEPSTELSLSLTHPDDRRKSYEALRNTEIHNSKYQIERRIIQPSGELRYVLSIGDTITDKMGNPIKIIGSLLDITDLKKAERKILKNNERLESLLGIAQHESSSIQELFNFALVEAIKLTESETGFIYLYDETTQLFTLNTWSPNAGIAYAVEKNLSTQIELAKTGSWGDVVRQRKPIIMNDFNPSYALVKGTPEGQVKLQKYLSIPVSRFGKIVAVVGVANKEDDYDNSDIYQLTLLMDSTWKSVEKFEMVEDLIKAKQKAQESDMLKSAFMANMSHEVRTPLNGIMGFSEMISQKETSDDDRRNYAKIIADCGHQLLSIVDNILDISKIATGQMEIHEEVVNINDLVNEIFMFFEPKMAEKNLLFRCNKSLSDDSCNVTTDKNKLWQILMNLLTNALKFTKNGSVTFGYSLENNFLHFFVEDTGIGIKPENHELIFDRFRQVDFDLTRDYGGTGLGLSITKSLAHLLGGKVWLKSTLGEGSTFFISIPYKPFRNELIDTQDHYHSSGTLFSKPLILVVEDNTFNFLYFNEVLTAENVVVIRASSGEEAIAICKENHEIELVLMDIKMAGINGYEATKRIKEFCPNLPIIAQTAFAMPEDREYAMQLGFDDFITKPVNNELLISIIVKYLK